jgi:hypothetical protein
MGMGAASQMGLGSLAVLAGSQGGLLGKPPTSVGAVQGPSTPAATLINFDNPTVQKALDNLIQSGPNLLRNLSASTAGTAQSTNAPSGMMYPGFGKMPSQY